MSLKIPGQYMGSLRASLVAGAFVVLLVLLAAPASAAPSAGPSGTCGVSGTVICIDPSTQTIGQTQVTTVDIRVDNIPVIANDASLFGADVRLTFNKTILCAQDGSHPCPNSSNAVTITPGPLLTQNDAFCPSSCYFILTNNADNTGGTITFILTRLAPAHSISGSGVLATITFYGIVGPSSPIHFTSAKLSDRNGVQIPATTQDGVINVGSPTAVVLSSFKAQDQSSNDHGITLAWKTASEIQTAGFNLYRSSRVEGPYARINPQLIPASSDPLVGGNYHYQDSNVDPGQTYYYQLEDVGLNGGSMRHPAVTATLGAAAETNGNSTPLLALGAVGGLLLIGAGWQIARRKHPANERASG